MEKYTVYKTTCLVNNKIYIGVHKTLDENDSYLGSGTVFKLAEEKYGKENFVKEILKTFDTKEEAYALEAELVTEEFIKLPTNYNLKLGGDGGWSFINENRLNVNSSKETSAKISKSQLARFAAGSNPTKGQKRPGVGLKSKEARLKNGGSYEGSNNPMYGVDLREVLSEEAIKEWGSRISKSNTGKVRTDAAKKKYSEVAKSRKWLIHISGKLASTTNPDDPRFNDPEWQSGKKWK